MSIYTIGNSYDISGYIDNVKIIVTYPTLLYFQEKQTV